MFDLFLTEVVHHVSKVDIVMTAYTSMGLDRKIQKAEQMCRQAQYYEGIVEALSAENRNLRVKITVRRREKMAEIEYPQ